jgi:two-component system OmpR family response regulator
MSRGAFIAITEDEADLADAYAEYLGELGYRTACAASGAGLDALIARHGTPHLLVLDMNLPGEPGTAILSRIADKKDYPILVASAIDDATDRAIALEMGADDWITKPFALRELAARIAGLLARYGAGPRRLLRLETVLVDLTAQKLLRDKPPGDAPRLDNAALNRDDIEPLGPGEVALIRAFADHPGQVLDREALLRLAPGEGDDVFDRAIDNRVSRLRRKLATETIRTARGHGYIYEPFVPRAREQG